MNKCSLCKKNIFNNVKKEMSICKLNSDKDDHVCENVDIFKVSATHDSQQKYEICCNEDPTTVKYEDNFKFKRYKRN